MGPAELHSCVKVKEKRKGPEEPVGHEGAT